MLSTNRRTSPNDPPHERRRPSAGVPAEQQLGHRDQEARPRGCGRHLLRRLLGQFGTDRSGYEGGRAWNLRLGLCVGAHDLDPGHERRDQRGGAVHRGGHSACAQAQDRAPGRANDGRSLSKRLRAGECGARPLPMPANLLPTV